MMFWLISRREARQRSLMDRFLSERALRRLSLEEQLRSGILTDAEANLIYEELLQDEINRLKEYEAWR
jgi:hypothetical protein